jgi:hypothetical protein
MKRSGQVALVLMGVTATTAAGAYLMPARSTECRPAATAAPAAAAAPGAAATQAAAQEEPCRRRRSWGSWRWGSGSYSYDRRRSSTIAPSTAFRPGPGTRSYKSSPSSSRGGFGSTGHSMSRSSGS